MIIRKALPAALMTAVMLAAPNLVSAQIVDTSGLASGGSAEVDIEADQLQVLDKDNKAVFSGNVQASRSNVRMSSDELEVRYGRGKDNNGKRKTQVTNLVATGNVLIVTPQQRITGAWARMDVRANQVTVGGNVTVRQGQSVIRGNQLFVDLNTNQSRISGGRVKGSFLPGN